jgi:predicted negative regulator of RcsB-dependent stress response
LAYIVRRVQELGLPFAASHREFSAFHYMEVESSQPPSQPMDFYHFVNWLQSNRKRLTIGGAVVFAIAAIVAIVIWHNDQTEADANAALMALPSAYGGGQRYSAHPNATALEDIAKQYPNTSAGEQAEILAASVLFSDGKYTDAEQAFKKFANDHSTSPLAPQANMGVAACLEAEGKVNEAIAKYQDVILHYPSDNYIASPAKLTLARLLEEQGKADQALKYYDELSRTQNQYDPWAAEAKERRELLLVKHPELRPAPTATMKPTVSPSMTTAPAKGSSQPKMLQLPSSAPKK